MAMTLYFSTVYNILIRGLHRHALSVVVGGSILLLYTVASASPELKNIQIAQGKDKTVLILELSEISEFRMMTLDKHRAEHAQSDRYRLVIDTPYFKTKMQPSLPVNGSDFITLVRYGSYTPHISRIVIESKKPLSIDSLQRDISPNSHKLSITITPTDTFQSTTKQTANWDTISQENTVAERQRQQVQNQSYAKIKANKNRIKIVLDAGHGGHDPGAIGRDGLYEKHVVLEIAKHVKATLEKTSTFDVLLTRADDRFISLRERSEIADRVDANLFISIHADKHSNPSVRGMSVYTLNHDRQQREIRQIKQNKTANNKVKQTFNHVGGQDVSGILGELGLEANNQSADTFAKMLVTSMQKNNIITLGNPAREASLGVLVARKTPSVLVETAYMSNKYDIINLQSTRWRKRFAKGLSDAIIAYFDAHPLVQ